MGDYLKVISDPKGPQAARWRARALLKAGRPAAAAPLYRRAVELGLRDPGAVAKGLQASLLAMATGAQAEGDAAVAFLARTRELGIPDTGRVLALEAVLRHRRGEMDLYERALERAGKAPRTPGLAKLLEGARGLGRDEKR